jgi:hypothetical protein
MRLRLIPIVLLAAVMVILSRELATADEGCDFSGWASECALSNSGSAVDITANASNPGSTGPSTPSGNSPVPPSQQAPAPEAEPEECGPMGCRGNYTVVMIPDVTLADLASFRPATPSLSGQPAGFAVVGMPANLVAEASVQSIPGTLLDWDVTVRFTPVAFEFAHGDGTSGVHGNGGATWEQLGQAQFTPTPTSHVYRDRGMYTVAVTVRYAASVDFGTGSWRPVPGYVTATSGGYAVRVLEARTALVDRTCTEDPNGPGC